MKRFLRSFIAVVCSLMIVFSSAVVPAFAAGGVLGGAADAAQSFVEWSVNSMNKFQNSFWRVIFGDDFNSASEDELKQSYNDYVQTFPAPAYSSGNELRWRLNIKSFAVIPENAASIVSSVGGTSFNLVWLASNSSVIERRCFLYVDEFKAPVSGDYRLGCYLNSSFSDTCFVGLGSSFPKYLLHSCPDLSRLGNGVPELGQYYEFPNIKGYSSGKVIVSSDAYFCLQGVQSVTTYANGFFEVICQPAVIPSDTYNINTRPTSITGGNYGIVGDNGQITKIEDNRTIVNEGDNTFYNPITGITTPITGWTYNYPDRTYDLTLDGGKTSTVTYGDENITITETTVNESGDTITNNYTIYYIIEGSNPDTPVDPPASCEHTWTETSSTAPTCTLSGSKLLTCSKCQQTKKEAIPALGHNWQVKQTVTTEYDETGQLVKQGYTIFECSTCHEQYKSTDGAAPPGGGGSTDPGDDKETIWDKLGKLIGTIGSGVIELIDAALGKLLDALIALAEGMMERLRTVVETVLSIFDEIPQIFGGFLDFLTALFPFLPPELMTILTFGILAVVFIGIIKAVRR